MKRKIVKNVISFILLLLSFIILFAGIYVYNNFGLIGFEQLLYSLINSEGTSTGAISEGILLVGISSVVLTVVVFIFLKKINKYFLNDLYFKIAIKTKEVKIKLFPITYKKSLVFSLIFLLLSILCSLKYLDFYTYLSKVINKSTIFEEEYVEPREVEITFPKKKQNLIQIYVESLETTAASKENGGAQDVSYISGLEKLALNNINFSNTEKLGGALASTGTGWTVAALISSTSGVPLKIPLSIANDYSGYGESVPGAYSLGEVLANNGYKNYFMMGSDASYAGREDYFVYHGNYELYDYNYAIENNWIPADYKEWWGYEDRKLFKFAKKKLTEIADSEEPFNFTILTADTHFLDGYQDASCEKVFDTKYANSFDCSDDMITSFVKWIKKQDFYENTTIVIMGDHLTMQSDFYANIDSSYDRTIFNTIINSRNDNTEHTKNRTFTSFDMYPTVLSALGCEIEGDRLALGTNLFSGKETLAEKLGISYFNNELSKSSFFYNEKILGDSYYEIYSKNKQD